MTRLIDLLTLTLILLFLCQCVTPRRNKKKNVSTTTSTTAKPIPLYVIDSTDQLQHLQEQINAINLSMSKLSSDLEANIVRIRTEQMVSSKQLKDMIEQLRKKILAKSNQDNTIEGSNDDVDSKTTTTPCVS